MSAACELLKPATEDEFECMCLELYKRVWEDPGCMRMGVKGQPQFGLDIIGNYKGRSAGVQCKHFIKKKFTLATVKDDIQQADDANIRIGHLIFATTAPNDVNLVLRVKELSDERKKQGKFTVSVDFWDAICGQIRMHPDVGRAFIPNFPGSDANRARVLLEEHAEIYAEDRAQNRAYHAESLKAQAQHADELSQIKEAVQALAPQSRGDEFNKLLAKQLDFARDKIRKGRFKEALDVLVNIQEQAATADDFSQFRWHACKGSCLLAAGQEAEAAEEFLIAYNLAPTEEKALANRARALLLQGKLEEGLAATDEGLAQHAASSILWALKINARLLLEHENPDEGVPQAVLGTSDVLYTLCYVRRAQGKRREAHEFASSSLAKDPTSIEIKRVVLASALEWATEDPVMAHFGQLAPEQIQVVRDALGALERIEETLESIESERASLEVTNNCAVALQLIGEQERAYRVAHRGLQLHPLAEGLLRIRINELDAKDDVQGIKGLCSGRLPELPEDVLIILAEVSASRGDLGWHEEIQATLATKELPKRKADDLFALYVHALSTSGKQDEAIQQAEAHLAAEPDSPMLLGLLARMRRKQGNQEIAEKLARRCFSLARKSTSSAEVLQAADLLHDFGLFFDAAELYRKLAAAPAADPITQRYFICLVHSDQRERARRVLDGLPTEVKETSAFRRIRAMLARQAGDWATLRDLLNVEIARSPKDAGIAVSYVGALHRLQEVEPLKAFLGADPFFDQARPENEFEFANYQSQYGFALLALNRLYRVLRLQPQDPRIAGYYLTILFLSEGLKELPVPEVAGPGTAVQLKYLNDTRWVVIEEASLPKASPWVEVAAPDSSQARLLAGKKLGDVFPIDTGFGKTETEIVQLESALAFASRKAQEVIAASVAPAGPLWSVNVAKKDGELDIEPIHESLRRRAAYVENLFERYQERRFPIATLADALGSDPVTLLLEWPSKQGQLFVGIGTHEEREHSRELLRCNGLHLCLTS
jgi:tetratricopeptide (TPR) repeat protein